MDIRKWINRVDQFGVWVLLFLVLLFVMTGYGMTKHLMDPVSAKYIHTQLLPVPLLVFFCLHVVKAIRNQFKRWKIFKSAAVLDGYVYAITLIVLLLLLWLYFR